jgi:NAD-dependent dihydropyrimidine dehydrogenase PreA subunit
MDDRKERVRPDLKFVPLSTNPATIRFFGTLMPGLLSLRASPRRFVQARIKARLTPRERLASFIDTEADDAARLDDLVLVVHRWQTNSFDALAFDRAKAFVTQAVRSSRQEGFTTEPVLPLSPAVNLPRLAAQAGLGNLSPYGLLVHPLFGPRLIISGLRTCHPVAPVPRWGGEGCSDCFACIDVCPQEPAVAKVIELGQCQSCTLCLAACPAGRETVISAETRTDGR